MIIRKIVMLLFLLAVTVGVQACGKEDDKDPTVEVDAGNDSGGVADPDDSGTPDDGGMGGNSGQPCVNGACGAGEVCFSDQCFAACSSVGDCPSSESCFDGRCAPDACVGVTCTTDETCVLGRCVETCTSPSDCPAAQTCFDPGFCAPDACDSVSCPLGQVCYQGSCYDPCVDNGDCTPPNACFEDRCKADACDGVVCPLGEVCYGGTCAAPCGSSTSCRSDADCTVAGESCDNINAATGDGYCGSCAAGSQTCWATGCVADSDCATGDYCFKTAGSPAGACMPDMCDPSADPACADGALSCRGDACDGVNCPLGQVCYEGGCFDPCTDNGDCTPPNLCFNNVCQADPCDGINCPLGQLCYDGSCYDTCVDNGDCSPPDACYDDRCKADACDGVACALGEVCFGGTCAAACGSSTSCRSDADCTVAGESCENINPTTGDGYCGGCGTGNAICWALGCTTDSDCAAGDYCFLDAGSPSGACMPDLCDPSADPACVDGALSCRMDACDGVNCPLGQVCYEGGCFDPCIDDGDCTPPNLCFNSVCQADPCDDIYCPLGQVCFEGACFDPCASADDCTPPDACYDGRCAADACQAVTCPLGDVCYGGGCFDPCAADDDCSPPQICLDSRCAVDACDGVVCPLGDVCYEGACYNPCADDGDCTTPQVCYNNLCSEDPCAGLTCPGTEACFGGTCYVSCFDDTDCTAPEACFDGACTTDPCLTYSCPAGQTCSCSEVAPGTPDTAVIAAGDTAAYRFSADAGELVTLRVSSPTVTGNMVLIDPNGTTLETVGFIASGDFAWLPYRIPQTGTYTVEVQAGTGTGGFTIALTSYGLESAMEPTLFDAAPGTGTSNYYFFGEPGELVVGDVVFDPLQSSSRASAKFQVLERTGTWSDTVTPVGSEPTLGSVTRGEPGLLAVTTTELTIYRLNVTRVLGTSDIDVRMDRMMPQTAVGTILVDSTGTCAGHQVGIPRLASLALLPGGTIEICDGTHLLYGTLKIGPGAAAIVRGSSPAAALQLGGPNPFSVPRPAISIDGATGAVVEQLAISTVDPNGYDTNRSVIDFGSTTSTDTRVQNLVVNMGPAATFGDSFLVASFPQTRLRVLDVDLSGAVSLGYLTGDDIEVRRCNIGTGPSDSVAGITVIGDGTFFTDNVIGEPSQSINFTLSFRGDALTLAGNTIFTSGSVFLGSQFTRHTGYLVADNSVTSSSFLVASSIFVLNGLDNLSFDRNQITDLGSSLTLPTLVATQVSGVFRNNRFEVFNRDMIALENDENATTSYPLDFFNNTFVIENTDPTARSTVFDISIDPPTAIAPIQIVNNIFVNRAVPAGSGQNAICTVSRVPGVNFNLYDNLTVPCATGGPSAGANSLIGDAALDADLRLTATSPAIDTGTAVGAPTDDFEGETRPKGAGHDIGADEF